MRNQMLSEQQPFQANRGYEAQTLRRVLEQDKDV